jgi:hypothetical protein
MALDLERGRNEPENEPQRKAFWAAREWMYSPEARTMAIRDRDQFNAQMDVRLQPLHQSRKNSVTLEASTLLRAYSSGDPKALGIPDLAAKVRAVAMTNFPDMYPATTGGVVWTGDAMQSYNAALSATQAFLVKAIQKDPEFQPSADMIDAVAMTHLTPVSVKGKKAIPLGLAKRNTPESAEFSPRNERSSFAFFSWDTNDAFADNQKRLLTLAAASWERTATQQARRAKILQHSGPAEGARIWESEVEKYKTGLWKDLIQERAPATAGEIGINPGGPKTSTETIYEQINTYVPDEDQ